MTKTPKYNLAAVKRYNEKFDRLTIYTPKGTKERIQKITNESVNEYVNRLIKEDFERVERLQKYGIIRPADTIKESRQ